MEKKGLKYRLIQELMRMNLEKHQMDGVSVVAYYVRMADFENDHDIPRLSDSTVTSKIDYLAKPELKATRTSIITGGCRETRNQRAVLKGVGEALS